MLQQATPSGPVLARTASAQQHTREQQPFSSQQADAAVEAINLCDDDDDAEEAMLDAATPRLGVTQQQQQPLQCATGDNTPCVPAPPQATHATPAFPAPVRPTPATPAAAAAPGSSMPPPSNSSHAKASASKAAVEVFLTPEQRQQLLDACRQELPLLEAALDQRPDLSAHLDVGSGKKALDLKQQVSLLVEGASLPLAALAERISSVLSSSRRSSSPGKQPLAATTGGLAAGAAVGTEAQQQQQAAAPGSGPSVLVVRNLIQDVAIRKSFGLQDGEDEEAAERRRGEGSRGGHAAGAAVAAAARLAFF